MSFRVSTRTRVYAPHSDEMVTKQSMKNECDINNILTQFKKTGIVTHMSSVEPSYTDLPDQMDYQQSLEVLDRAQEAFDALPSVVRRYFDNDPSLLLAALGDDKQRGKLEELGILNPQPDPRPPAQPRSILPDQNPPTLEPA